MTAGRTPRAADGRRRSARTPAAGRLTLLAAVAVLAGAPARAQDIQIRYEKFKLDNGLTVIVHEDHKAPVVGVAVWYKVGSADEPRGKTGFAHLFEHLMFYGSENYDDAWFKALSEMGATRYNGTTNFDYTNYLETVPTPALERTLWLESDRMGHLLGAVTQAKLDEQRGVVENEKRQSEGRPYGRVFTNIQESLFPEGHPYHHSTFGSLEDLNRASLGDVRAWFKDNYGPSNAILVLAGDITAASARALVAKYFGDIPPGPPLTRLDRWVPNRAHPTRATMYDQVPQAQIYRVWTTPAVTDPRSTDLLIAASVLGDGKNSRLYKDLVYDKQIATDASVFSYQLPLASIFGVVVQVRPGGDVAKVEAEVDRQIAAFLEKGPTREEVALVSTKRKGSIIRGLDEVGGFGGQAPTLAEGELLAGDPNYFKRQLADLDRAAPASVTAAARAWLGDGWHQLEVLPYPGYAASTRGVDRAKGLPPITGEAKLDFPAIEETRLANGVRVLLASRSTIPVVDVTLQFDAGYAADPSDKPGLANFTTTMLAEGAGPYDALALAGELDRLGATIDADSNLDASFVSLSALKANLAPSLALLGDVVLRPRFAPQEIERQRALTLAQIQQERADPRSIAERLLTPLLYGPGHPYGKPMTGTGTERTVAQLTRGDLLAFKDRWLRPDDATIFVVGDTTMAEIKPRLESLFGGWRAASPAPRKDIAPVPLPTGPRAILIDRPGAQQSFILAGQLAPPTSAPNNVAIETMNEVIGGGFLSRLNVNLREKKGWSYGALSFLVGARGQRTLFLTAPVQTDKTGPAIGEIRKEFASFLADKPPTDEEVGRVKLDKVRSLPGQIETAKAVLASLEASVRFGRPLDYPATLPAKYRALSTADVAAAAREVLRPDRLVWIIVGDASRICAEVEAAGIGPVEVKTMNDAP